MKKSERVWVTIFLLLCMAFLSAIFAVQGSLLSTMIDQYRLNAASQGTANTVAFAGGIIALVSAFALQGRWQKRTLVKASVLLCAAGLAMLWLAPNYGVYVAAWFVAGFGLGLMDTLLSACMADLYTGRQAVRMMCILHTVYGLSSVLSPMGYAAMLAIGMLWKRIYLVIAAVGVMIVAGALIVRKTAGIVDREPLSSQRISLVNILPDLHRGGLLWLTAAMVFHGVFLSGLNTWINRYADGLAASIAIPAQSCVFLGVMLSRLLMPFLPIDSRKYVVSGGVAAALALCIGLMIPNGWVLRALLMLSSLMFGALIPCMLTIGCERHKQNTLLATTGMMLALYLGQAISSPVIAALEAAIDLRAGMMLCAVSMAACSLCCAADARAERKER